MQKIFSGDILDLLQKLLIITCIAIPPWLSFIKYFRSKIHVVFRVLMFIGYIYLITKFSEMLPFILVIVVIFMVYSKKNKEEIYFLRPLNEKRREVFLKAFIFKFVITIVNLVFITILITFGVKPVSQEISKVIMKANWFGIIYLSVFTVIVAPILEEFIFRHTLYRQLSKRIGKIAACLISSCLFALLHFNFAGTISFLGVAIYNCYLYDKYGYRAAVVNHFVFNFISTAMMIGTKIHNG